MGPLPDPGDLWGLSVAHYDQLSNHQEHQKVTGRKAQ